MGKIEIDHTGSGGGITLSSDGTDLLLGGTAIGGGATEYTYSDKTSAYTITSSDLGKIIRFTSATTLNATLPAGSGLNTGWYVFIWNDGTGVISVKPSGSDYIGATSGIGLDASDPYKLQRGKGISLSWNGTRWNILFEKQHDYYRHSVAIGDNALAGNNYSLAIGHASVAGTVGTIAIGTGLLGAATANSYYGVAIGEYSTANGQYSIALGRSRTGGTSSFAAVIDNNTSSYGATGANSVAIGRQAKASATSAHAFGSSSTGNIASGNNSWAQGAAATASAIGARAMGSSVTADGYASIAKGAYGDVNGVQYRETYGFGSTFQRSIFVLQDTTSDATATILSTNGVASAIGATTQVTLPNNTAFAFHGTIVARESATDGTDCAAWKIEGLIRREGSASTTTLVNSATTVIDNSYSWGMALSADTTNGCLKIEVTGAASTNIRWVATIYTSEVTYA